MQLVAVNVAVALLGCCHGTHVGECHLFLDLSGGVAILLNSPSLTDTTHYGSGQFQNVFENVGAHVSAAMQYEDVCIIDMHTVCISKNSGRVWHTSNIKAWTFVNDVTASGPNFPR